MKNDTKVGTTKPPVDREAIRVLAIELGAREAARRTGVNENTILSWAHRCRWNLPKRAGRPAINPAIELQSKPGDILIAEHKSLEAKTKTSLSRAVAKAAEHASTQPPLEVHNPAQLRDLASSATKVFGWDKKNKPDVQINQLVLTPDAGQALREMNALLEEGGDISKERWEELQNRINAGRTDGIVTPELLEQMRAARETDKDEKGLLTDGNAQPGQPI